MRQKQNETLVALHGPIISSAQMAAQHEQMHLLADRSLTVPWTIKFTHVYFDVEKIFNFHSGEDLSLNLKEIWKFNLIYRDNEIWTDMKNFIVIILGGISPSPNYQWWKQLCCLIFLVETEIHFLSGLFDEQKIQKNSIYLK